MGWVNGTPWRTGCSKPERLNLADVARVVWATGSGNGFGQRASIISASTLAVKGAQLAKASPMLPCHVRRCLAPVRVTRVTPCCHYGTRKLHRATRGRLPQAEPCVTQARWGNPLLEQKLPLPSNNCTEGCGVSGALTPAVELWITLADGPQGPTMWPLKEQLVHNEPRPLATWVRATRLRTA